MALSPCSLLDTAKLSINLFDLRWELCVHSRKPEEDHYGCPPERRRVERAGFVSRLLPWWCLLLQRPTSEPNSSAIVPPQFFLSQKYIRREERRKEERRFVFFCFRQTAAPQLACLVGPAEDFPIGVHAQQATQHDGEIAAAVTPVPPKHRLQPRF